MCRGVSAALRARGYGKIVNLSGGGATGAAAAHQRLRGVQGRGGAVHRDAGRGARRTRASTSTRSRPGALTRACWTRCSRPGRSGSGAGVLRAGAEAAASEGGTPLEKGAALAVFLASAASDGITGRLLSAVWDDWADCRSGASELAASDIYTLRRIVPEDRGSDWDDAGCASPSSAAA